MSTVRIFWCLSKYLTGWFHSFYNIFHPASSSFYVPVNLKISIRPTFRPPLPPLPFLGIWHFKWACFFWVTMLCYEETKCHFLMTSKLTIKTFNIFLQLFPCSVKMISYPIFWSSGTQEIIKCLGYARGSGLRWKQGWWSICLINALLCHFSVGVSQLFPSHKDWVLLHIMYGWIDLTFITYWL